MTWFEQAKHKFKIKYGTKYLYLVQVKIESLVFGNVVTNTRQQKQINKPKQTKPIT